jgi:hypothetical protein
MHNKSADQTTAPKQFSQHPSEPFPILPPQPSTEPTSIAESVIRTRETARSAKELATIFLPAEPAADAEAYEEQELDPERPRVTVLCGGAKIEDGLDLALLKRVALAIGRG